MKPEHGQIYKMATVTFTIPNGILSRVLDGVAYANGYQDVIDGQPNSESKADFAKRMIRLYVKQCVISYESANAGKQAAEIARIAAESEIQINE